MAVVKLESAESFKAFIDKDTLTLVDYYADWCPPCRNFAPILDKIAQELAAKVTVGKVNVDELSDVSAQQGMMRNLSVILLHFYLQKLA